MNRIPWVLIFLLFASTVSAQTGGITIAGVHLRLGMSSTQASEALAVAGFKLNASGNDLYIARAQARLDIDNVVGLLRVNDGRIVDAVKFLVQADSDQNLQALMLALADAATALEHDGNSRSILRRGTNPYCEAPACANTSIELLCGSKKLILAHTKMSTTEHHIDSFVLSESLLPQLPR